MLPNISLRRERASLSDRPKSKSQKRHQKPALKAHAKEPTTMEPQQKVRCLGREASRNRFHFAVVHRPEVMAWPPSEVKQSRRVQPITIIAILKQALLTV